MKQFNWKEIVIKAPTYNGEEYNLHVKYLPCELDNERKTI